MVDPIFSKANILVVEDFEPWRSKVREILQARPEWTIVSEACDGSEAVQKATTLQPDIILLDFGLPTLNGIEAAKLIQQRCPKRRRIWGIDDESSHPRLCSGVADGVTRNIVSLFREPDAGNLPVRFDERLQRC